MLRVLVLALSGLAAPSLKPSQLRCPNMADIRSDYIKENFDLAKFASGERFYEIGYKDYTQSRKADCQTSTKVIGELDGQPAIKDKFTIYLKQYFYNAVSDLNMVLTDTPGLFEGVWIQDGQRVNVTFPNVVLDVGVNPKTGKYDWSVEFQCFEENDELSFYAFNFYSSTNDDTFYEPMLKVAQDKIGAFINHDYKTINSPFFSGPYGKIKVPVLGYLDIINIDGEGIHRPTHKKCKYK